MRDMEKSQSHTHTGFGRDEVHLCSRHNSPLNTFCCTDELVICAICASTDHIGHTFCLVREERRRKQVELKKLKQRSQELQRQDGTKALVKEKARETEDFCEAVLTRVIDLLQTSYMSLRDKVQALETKALSVVPAQEAAEMKRRCTALDRLAHTDSDVNFLLGWPSVHQLWETDLTELTDDLRLPFESLQNAVDSFGNQLKEFCNKGFTKIKNAPEFDHQVLWKEDGDVIDLDLSDEMAVDDHMLDYSSDGEEVPVPFKTRADLLKYACNLTLDPDTAHKDLLVSRDLKEVRWAPISGRGPAVNRPERFITRRQLLCKEGLQADCCYYEVEITGAKAEIALAYKTIDRKRFKHSAFGGNANSWSLDCTSTYYSVSHRGDSVQLSSVPEHKRIGVFLKFREGTVSFYEVSDTMKFLYTKEGDFREPLYPGFWIGEACCLKICELLE